MRRLEFNDKYFDNRHLNDARRLQAFKIEMETISKFVDYTSTVCDIGCSTGEFLEYLGWKGKRYGIEINELAASYAEGKGIKIVKDLSNIDTELQCVIMRGTLQHIQSPFTTLAEIYEKLVPGGFLFIFSTPNIDSIYFRIFQDLPAFDYPLNYWLTGFKNLRLVCEREGFKVRDIKYPYLRSGYMSALDLPKFILRLLIRKRSLMAAFPGNMMNIVLQK